MPEDLLGIEPPINPVAVQFVEKRTSTARIMFNEPVVENDLFQIVKNGVVIREITIPLGKSGRVFMQGGAVVQ